MSPHRKKLSSIVSVLQNVWVFALQAEETLGSFSVFYCIIHLTKDTNKTITKQWFKKKKNSQ